MMGASGTVNGADLRRACGRFAAGNADAFDGADTLPSPAGLPFVAGAIAHLDCTTYAVCDGGDHRIPIGSVDGLAVHAGRPLLFYDGRILSRLAPIASSVTP